MVWDGSSERGFRGAMKRSSAWGLRYWRVSSTFTLASRPQSNRRKMRTLL